MIFVACPSAAASKASRLRSLITESSAPASFSILIPCAFACWTSRMASASPFAFWIAASFSASACKIIACFWPSATRIALCFCPSAIRIASRRSRSARICFSIASLIASGGMMFFTSTRFTLIPHGSVASSRMLRIFVLITSRLVNVWSSSKSPMILRSVVAERFSRALIGRSTPYV